MADDNLATETLTVTASDGHRFDLTAIVPADVSAVLLFLPALGAAARVYARFARELAGHGLAVCTTDWRGIASSTIRAGRRSDFGYRHLLEIDLPAVEHAVTQRFAGLPFWLGGHSLGGQMSMCYAGAHVERIAGVVLLASGSVHLRAYPPRLQRDIRRLALMSRISAPLFGYFPGKRVGFGGREASGLMRDWVHVARTGKYQPAGTLTDYEAAMSRLNKPVLAITFDADHWSPPSAADELLSKLPAGGSQHWHWDATQTGGHAFDHFSWTKQPALVAAGVARFIHGLTPSGNRA